METKIGKSHVARKALFQRGIRRGYLTIEDIEEALPPGSLTSSERWLLYYSLRAAEVEILGDEVEVLERLGLTAEAERAGGNAEKRGGDEEQEPEAVPPS